jgi:hypothetical protein
MTTCIILVDPDSADSKQIELIREDFGYIHLPSLFRLWFAEAEVGEAPSGDAKNGFAPASLLVRPLEARARISQLAEIAKQHPLAGHRPELPLWLEGIDHLFANWQAHFDPKTHDRLWLILQDESADAAECGLDSDEINNFRELYTDNWHELVDAAAQGKFSLVDECLLFPTRSLNFGDWRAWTQVFGLEYLPDPYFRRLDGNCTLYTSSATPLEVVPYEEFIAGNAEVAEKVPLDGMTLYALNPEDILSAVAANCFHNTYDAVRALDIPGLYLVCQDARWGLAVDGGRLLLPCAFADIRPLGLGPDAPCPGEYERDLFSGHWPEQAIAQWLADSPPDSILLMIEVRDAEGCYVVDQAGRLIIPPGYAGFAPVINKETEATHWQDPRWLELRDHAGKSGIWNVRTACPAVPCEYGLARVLTTPGETPPCVLLADKSAYDADDPPLFRIVDMRGQAALPGEFRWLNAEACEDNAEYLFLNYFAAQEALAEAFARQGTVFARRVQDGETGPVVVSPGQPDRPVEGALADLFAKDDKPQTARQLAMLYEKGEYAAGSPQKAQHWRKQARDAAIRRLGEESPGSAERQAREGYREVLTDYVRGLYNDDGSKQARRAARAEIDFMIGQPDAWGHSETLLLLYGIVLLDAAAGTPDFVRGIHSLTIAADSNNAEAAYQLGRCYLFGHGVKRDPFKAHELLAAAEKGGDQRALPELIATLVLLSSRRDIPAEKQASFAQELEYFKQKRDDDGASTMAPGVPEVRAIPRFSAWRPRLLAALWRFMN